MNLQPLEAASSSVPIVTRALPGSEAVVAEALNQ